MPNESRPFRPAFPGSRNRRHEPERPRTKGFTPLYRGHSQLQSVLFYIFATLAVISALLVVSHRNPVTCAVSLVLTLFSTAVLFILLTAPFIAVIQILVYAGAIMVLFLFTVMFLDLRERALVFDTRHAMPKFAVVVGVASVVGVVSFFVFKQALSIGGPAQAHTAGFGSIAGVSRLMFTDYILPFELTSILIVVAILGVVTIASRRAE